MSGWRRTWTRLSLARLYLVLAAVPLIMTAQVSRVAFVTAAVAVTVVSVVFFVGLAKWRRYRRAQSDRSDPAGPNHDERSGSAQKRPHVPPESA